MSLSANTQTRVISNRAGRKVSYAIHRAPQRPDRPMVALLEETPRGRNVVMLSPEEITDLFQFSMFDVDNPPKKGDQPQCN